MVEQLSVQAPVPPSHAPEIEPVEIAVQMTYDASTGIVTYDPQQITIDGPSLLSLELSTLNPGTGAEARFYGFTVSANWPSVVQMSFQSDSELRIAVPFPATPGGSFIFKPTIEATGAPILKQGSLQLNVPNTAQSTAQNTGQNTVQVSDGPPILATYDSATGNISYSPKQVSVPPSPTPTTITVTIQTTNPATFGPATFYGFAIKTGWLPQMEIGITQSVITILDPNTEEFPLPGNFGFVTLVQVPAGAPAATSNPDPTIYNEPIGGTFSA